MHCRVCKVIVAKMYSAFPRVPEEIHLPVVPGNSESWAGGGLCPLPQGNSSSGLTQVKQLPRPPKVDRPQEGRNTAFLLLPKTT